MEANHIKYQRVHYQRESSEDEDRKHLMATRLESLINVEDVNCLVEAF